MKNTFLQSPVIALQHIKSSAWPFGRFHSKTYVEENVRKGFVCVIYTTITMVTQAQFLPMLIRNLRVKKALWYMVSPNEATLQGRSIISTTHRAKKIGVNKTANSENILKTGHSSTMGDPLTFHVMRKSKHGSS